MPRRKYDFSRSKKNAIKRAFGYTCAACGCDDPDFMSADHWQPGVKEDDGVCLCQACNAAKGDITVPSGLRLTPREPVHVVTHKEYRAQIAENRKAFAKWIGGYNVRGDLKVRAIPFKAPY